MVQVGDILGFHLVNNETIGDDFSIQYHANTSGINVHYMQIAQPLQEIQFNTLHVTLMNAAPIIHIEIGKYSLGLRTRDESVSIVNSTDAKYS